MEEIKVKIMKKNDIAVSEVLGTILLLGIAISLFSVLSTIVLSFPFEPSTPSVNLIGYVDGNNITIEHTGGETLDLDTKLIVKINDSNAFSFIVSQLLDSNALSNNLWNLGEKAIIDASKSPINEIIVNARVDVTVVDVPSNSVVLMGVLQEVS